MNYEILMKKCIELAKNGYGAVSPNPLVGCVVLNKGNGIISSGYHEKFGENHAERNALQNLDVSETSGGTLIVNLEPCVHYGKTPPCVDLIISKRIKKVVIGMRDVNPIVAGNGVKKLRDAGIEVVEGILEKECKKLNEVFIKNVTMSKPYVAIKTATTIDGKIATSCGSSKWITSKAARDEVKNIRNRYDAILTSSSTILADNPQMLHNKKIILDRTLKTDFENSKIYKSGYCYIFYASGTITEQQKYKLEQLKSINNLQFIPVNSYDGKLDVGEVLSKVYEMGINSILVEAGGRVNGSLLKYADKIYQFIAPKILGDNRGLSCFDFRFVDSISEADKFIIDSVEYFSPDILVTLYPE